MRHDLTLDGYAFRLRPVQERDTDFILELRTDPRLNRYIHATAGDPAAHLAWMAAYYARVGDFYFIVERRENGQREGTVALCGIQPSSSAEWGRWLMRAGSLGPIESAWLVYRMAFERLSLEKVFSRTMVRNEKVISFHDSCGCRRRQTVRIDGEEFIEHEMTQAAWVLVGPEMETKARRIGGLIHA